LRINENELDEGENGERLWEGKPFTGIAFELHLNGNLAIEVEIENGIENGTVREWYPSGKLKLEASGKNGEPDKRITEWFENGNLKSEAIIHFGRQIKEKIWNEHDVLISDFDASSGN
jgi:antitoxin component YwqK of YwqJK toxin-antitoxin module